MIPDKDIIGFFEEYDLTPGMSQVICDRIDYLLIIFNALEKSEGFGAFVREALSPIGHHEYEFVFETWEELLNCYATYMCGFKGLKC